MDQEIRIKHMLDSMRQITHGDAAPFKEDLDAFIGAYRYGIKKHAAADISEIRTVDDPDGIMAVLAEHLRQRRGESLDDLDVLCLAGSVLVSLGFQGLGNRLEGVFCSHVVSMFEQGKKRLSTGRISKFSEEDMEKACEDVRALMSRNKKISRSDACKRIADEDSRFTGRTLIRWLKKSDEIKGQT
ncbi:hypothetical protein ACET77_02795 [Aeromonas allosaccharophila]|uniref:hypothetical protein n=1 Tax=Aeromonas allosaccharophila TaxID=656 RepID=UPI0038D1DFA8